MASRSATVKIDVVMDDKPVKASVQNIEREMKKTGNAFSSVATSAKMIGGVVAGSAVAGAVMDFARDSIQAFSNLNESINAVNVTFGDSADGILKLGENAADSLGMANSEFNTLAVGFSAFTEKIADASGGNVVDVMDTLTTRIADFASVMNLEVPEAAEKFRSGLAGETEPLRQFGIDVSAAAVNAKALEMGLADSSSQLSEQDKILARYELIMDQTNKTAGDFANTQDDLANATRRANARLEDAQATFGEFIAVPWNDLVGTVGNLGTALDGTGESGEESGRRFKDAWTVASSFLSPAYAMLRTGLFDIAEGNREAAAAAEAAEAAQRKQRDLLLRLNDATDDYVDSTDDATEATADFTEEQLAAADPAFALLRAYDRFTGAQRSYNDAVSEFGADSLQARSAMGDLLESTATLNGAQHVFNTTHGPEGEQVWKDLALQAGIYGDDLGALLDFLDRIATKTRNMPPLPVGSGGTGSTRDGIMRFHDGGVVPGPAGQEVLAMVKGGETVLPTHDPSFSLTAKNGGSGTVINYYGGTQIGNERILKELLEMGRRG